MLCTPYAPSPSAVRRSEWLLGPVPACEMQRDPANQLPAYLFHLYRHQYQDAELHAVAAALPTELHRPCAVEGPTARQRLGFEGEQAP